MDHDRAFFEAIREAPDDDVPRLIYADWLEEQGGNERAARAAFIRIQCRLAELPEDDPARDALEDEEADLLAEYERAWTEPLLGIADDWTFSRGFVERLSLGVAKFLENAEQLHEGYPVRALHLLLHPRDIPHLIACPQLQEIETLDFRGDHLNDRALQQLLTSPFLGRLRALHLSGNGINTPGIRALVGSPLFRRLRSLDLSRNIALGDSAARLLAGSATADCLEVLNLANTNLTLDGVLDLFQSTQFPCLEDLNVAGARNIGTRPAASLQQISQAKVLAQLRTLDLSDIRLLPSFLPSLLHSSAASNLRALSLRNLALEVRSIEMLARSSSLTHLTALDLRQNRLEAAGARQAADSPYLRSLTYLNMGFNNLRDKGALALAESPFLARLRVLNVDGNAIGGPGLQALAKSANLEHLVQWSLAANFIGPDFLRLLADSSHLKHLRHLDFSDAYLEEESGRILAGAPKLDGLVTLRLAKNLLGDGGAKALAQSPYLRRLLLLDLNDNRIGKAGAEALAAAAWRRMRHLDVRGNVFTDTQENLLRQRFGAAVVLAT
jgi:uncharacterized protein (TIGR02996 family)